MNEFGYIIYDTIVGNKMMVFIFSGGMGDDGEWKGG